MVDSRFYDKQGPFTLKELAALCEGALEAGNEAEHIHDVASLSTANKKEISFLSNTKYTQELRDSQAGACIIAPKEAHLAPKGMAIIQHENPYYAYAVIAQAFYPGQPASSQIDDTAIIDPSATLGDKVVVGPGAIIGKNVTIADNSWVGAQVILGDGVEIGSDCYIHAQVTISHATIGNNVEIFSGTRIGQDGFGFATHQGKHITVPQLGMVMIGNDVSIGANCTVDRGSASNTVIGDGCRIDNLVQVAHNVVLGKGCVIVSQVGIAGSTTLGDYVVAGGQVGIAGHLTIGTGAQLAAQAGVTKDIDPGAIMGGTPSVPLRQYHKQAIILKNLAEKK